MNIKEIRDYTGLTQKGFSEKFGIPIGTVRRWEYGESTPAPYLVRLICMQLPFEKRNLEMISGKSGATYYYDKMSSCVMDNKGTKIPVHEDLTDVKRQNLSLYLDDLFDAYYEITKKFDKDCRIDKQEDIIWS